MRRSPAAVGSALFFLVGPGIMAGLVSWLLTRWQVREPVPYWAPMRVLGVMLLAAGLVVLVQAFVRFVLEGLGTRHRSPPPSASSSAGRIATCATPCTWRYWRPSSVRRCS